MPSIDEPLSGQSSRTSSFQAERHNSVQPANSYLRPEDAFHASSPPRKPCLQHTDSITSIPSGELHSTRGKRSTHSSASSRKRSSHQAGKRQWKKLLWVKQSFPDNYTDEETFLDHLQRNPRLRPYEFWPLVADSTIIVQHVCSVIIFVCCFTGIFQERVKPETVVGWATIGTVTGWVLREYWQTCEDAEAAATLEAQRDGTAEVVTENASQSPASETADFGMPFKEQHMPLATTANGYLTHVRNTSLASAGGSSIAASPTLANDELYHSQIFSPTPMHLPPWHGNSSLSPRMQERLATIKSAILIYCSLLGLSPILKSLTMSTSSDSIWALSSGLMILNVMTFDYGAGPESKFPASLSTNAAIMASTVLASRLPSTTHVFSLTLFSIEVFGLFPVFRRHLRHHSWTGHLCLTTFLISIASGGLSMTISGGGYIMGIVGVVLGGITIGLSMGLTSWWLIGLQRYKNEIHGPWDPARPVIRRHWD